MYDIFLHLDDPATKAALPTSETDLKFIRAGFANVPNILEEQINFAPDGVCVHHESFFAQLSHKVSSDLISSGIIQHQFNYFLDFEIKPLVDLPKGPKVFAIEDLKFGFIVWLIACGISLIAFAGEFLYKGLKVKILRFVQSWVGIYLFLRTLVEIGLRRLH